MLTFLSSFSSRIKGTKSDHSEHSWYLNYTFARLQFSQCSVGGATWWQQPLSLLLLHMRRDIRQTNKGNHACLYNIRQLAYKSHQFKPGRGADFWWRSAAWQLCCRRLEWFMSSFSRRPMETRLLSIRRRHITYTGTGLLLFACVQPPGTEGPIHADKNSIITPLMPPTHFERRKTGCRLQLRVNECRRMGWVNCMMSVLINYICRRVWTSVSSTPPSWNPGPTIHLSCPCICLSSDIIINQCDCIM